MGKSVASREGGGFVLQVWYLPPVGPKVSRYPGPTPPSHRGERAKPSVRGSVCRAGLVPPQQSPASLPLSWARSPVSRRARVLWVSCTGKRTGVPQRAIQHFLGTKIGNSTASFRKLGRCRASLVHPPVGPEKSPETGDPPPMPRRVSLHIGPGATARQERCGSGALPCSPRKSSRKEGPAARVTPRRTSHRSPHRTGRS